MKMLFVAIFLMLSPFTDLDKIAKINKAKKEAKEAYLAGDYQTANAKYKLLIDSLGVQEEEVQLNYAHSQYQLNDTTNAVTTYQNLTESSNNNISSIAQQQLGQILFDKKQYEPALEHYKNALRKDPANQDARYNYELLKKILKEQEQENKDKQDNKDQDQQDKKEQDKQDQDQNKDQKQDQEKKDQEKKDQEQQDKKEQEQNQKDKEEQQKDQEQKDQEKKDGEKDEEQDKKEQEQKDPQEKEGEKSEEEKKEEPTPSPSDKLKEMNISEEKAQMILEAMKNNEIQYIQQNKRKATKKKDSDKPDW